MTSVSFHWKAEDITPRLKQAVGSIVLTWAMIDAEVTRMTLLFWRVDHPKEHLPPRFKRRVRILLEYAAELYDDEPDEHLVFKWYIQRLRTASGHRDKIVHGMPGSITRGKRTYEGLWVPNTFGKDAYVPMKISELIDLSGELHQLHAETTAVSIAWSAAQSASSAYEHFTEVEGKWTKITKNNRDPMLPRWNPPPPKFRG